MKIKKFLSLSAIVLTVFAACKKETPEVQQNPQNTALQFATVKGTALAANGNTDYTK